jgi:hypothetical protein
MNLRRKHYYTQEEISITTDIKVLLEEAKAKLLEIYKKDKYINAFETYKSYIKCRLETWRMSGKITKWYPYEDDVIDIVVQDVIRIELDRESIDKIKTFIDPEQFLREVSY